MLFPILKRSNVGQAEMVDLGHPLDWFFRDFAGSPRLQSTSFPKLNIHEDSDNYYVDADLPGLEKKDLSIKISDGVLVISSERKTESEGQDKTWHRVERYSGNYQRSITLPEDVRAEDIRADYKNGVLSVTIPKREKAKPKELSVEIR